MRSISEYLSLNEILLYIEKNLFNILPAIILFILYKPIKRYLSTFFNKLYTRIFKDNHGLITFLNSITRFVIDIIIIFTILDLLGIDLQKFGAIISAFALVFGFAFKDTLGNMFGGMIILVFKPFVVGDIIIYAGYEGRVTKIEIFYTYLINYSNEEVIIPNGSIINSELKNISVHTYRRLDIKVGVGYGSNIEEVKQTIKEIIFKRKEDLFEVDKKPYLIGMAEIGASSLNFDIKVHVKPTNYLAAKYYLNESIKTEFDAKGIELPFNIIDLQVNPNFNNLNIKNDKES
ncbi:mechanosensitive ion channel family protein [Oceanivirga salmonicida]|uniref:mechanosensitive ion channel family protein n=1 Tax=Oceanivirga salmonicida TaxID=1769291 RepID=UPI00083368C8|nr:mechanosensitive ion channel family protein [Oceanivirga salmonicida]